MLPQNVLSVPYVGASFLPPRNIKKAPLVDYELGGIAIQDASQGLRFQTWKGEVVGASVVLSAPTAAPTVVVTQAGITEFQFTFDHNMQPFVAYMVNGLVARFYWFDTTLGGFTTTTLPDGSYSVRCSHDDKRAPEAQTSDVILTYMRAGTLYFRMQRERYLVERSLKSGYTSHVIGAFGMNRVYRLQWQVSFILPYPEPEPASLVPSSAIEGAGDLALVVNGAGFTLGSRVQWEGGALATTYVSPTQLVALVPAALLLVVGPADVTVTNPLPGGGTSAPLTFTVIGTYRRLTQSGDVRRTQANDVRVTQEAP